MGRLGQWQDEHRPLVDERGNVIGIVSAKLDAAVALAARISNHVWTLEEIVGLLP
ncbi:MAG TPA: hypothetical protein VIK59_07605 [Verrucomicrobiae bacterium]|nr:hypothetical protein [Candidatus Saccharimonadales bacterium]